MTVKILSARAAYAQWLSFPGGGPNLIGKLIDEVLHERWNDQPLKSRQFREFFLSLMHVHSAMLCATAEGGHGLPGIQQAGRIERGFYRMEHFQLPRLELGAHLIDFFDTDPVLASNGPSGVNAHL
jgi:hypothetical protein